MSPHPQPVTIQLNSVEAIERLIGGDGELEIAIRNNVVQKFAERHLKPLLNSDITRKFYREAEEGILALQQNAIEREIGKFKSSGYSRTFTPTPELRKAVDETIDTAIREYVRTAVDAAVAVWTDEKIAEVIKRRVDAHVIDRINDGVTYALREIQSKIKVPV